MDEGARNSWCLILLPQGSPHRRSQENSIGSSHAPQRQPPKPPQEQLLGPPEDPRIESLCKDIDELRKQLIPSASNVRKGNPFSFEILAATLSNHVRLPQFANYGGEKGDPRDHIDQFVAAMDLVNPSDPMLCRIFRTTLVG
ncbi:hypothetical protein Salat_2917200 [Sesamum alatum]|uniref:Uncharacterized protein n=1 Tax=Sesamum alatum TaxID=300844 RepID=A0AAE2C8K5_9LAMI|nr:hypothetical protein Salat_2917200 [Sesamum alatum]